MGLEQTIDLTGHLGRDAELRTTPNGKSVADFSLATTDRYNDVTTWWKITIWGKLAESVTQYLTKGTKVRVRGAMTSPEAHTYTNSTGDIVVANYEVTARDLDLQGKAEGTSNQADNPNHVAEPVTADADQIPF